MAPIAAVGIVDILVIIIMSCRPIFPLGSNIIEAIQNKDSAIENCIVCKRIPNRYWVLNRYRIDNHFTAVTPTVTVNCILSAVYMDTCIEVLH